MDIRLSRSEWSPEAQLKMLKEDHTVKSVPVINCVEKARRVVILQVESFDWSLLVGHFNGEDVVPFLHRVASVSPPIAVKPNHGSISGSSGSDFQVLTGFRPNLPFPVYKAAPCVFRGSLPWSCRQKGIPTAVFHGNSADFWNRREAFQRMGVGRFYSLLDFKDAPNSRWGIPDATVLQRVGDWAVTQNGTFLAFCITLSSHAPFDLVGPPDSLRTPVVERYFRSIRYVDGAIRNFVEQWPIDDTVFVLYGDHASNVRERGYMSYPGDTEIVPLLIFRLRGGEVFPVAIQAPSQPVELASLHGLVSTLLELGSSVSDLPCE
jgi:phosphoglycerol transferase MdoB-like AlkP superfamily enzyme